MNKKISFFFLGLALAATVFADLGFFVSFNSHEALKVFTSQAIWNKEPQPSFSDTLLMMSSFQPNRQEIVVFGNIIKGENVLIENGLWDTKKTTLGLGFGKVMSIPFSLPKFAAKFALDFSAGPYFHVFLSNQYTHISGQTNKQVAKTSVFERVQYGLYSSVRLRLLQFKQYLNALDFSLGLHFFMPFSNHEFNADSRARYHLFKTFAFAGISF
jgi:hypothetical protein